MKLFLSRRYNGMYQLTRLPPVVRRMVGLAESDVYPQPGDPLTLSGLCPVSVKALFKLDMRPCEVTRVQVTGSELPPDPYEEPHQYMGEASDGRYGTGQDLGDDPVRLSQ